MTTATEAAAPNAPAETQTSIQSQAAEAQPTTAENKPAAVASAEEKDPNWLPARLERERRAILGKLGFESIDAAMAAREELKKRQDAEKTETERLRGQLSELEAKAKRAADLEAVISKRVEAELASLSEEQRAAVLAIAGEDHSAQLRTIDALKPTWTKKEAEAAVAAAAPAAKPAPISTSPAGKGPAPAAAEAEDHKATFERLSKTDPQKAAAYRIQNWSAFFPNS